MIRKFKLWSETSPEAKMTLRPILGMRGWDDLSTEEKIKILRHLFRYGWLKDSENLVKVAVNLNEMYKVQTFATQIFEHGGPHSSYGSYDSCCKEAASKDILSILKNEKSDVAIETLSLYGQTLIENYYLNKPKPTKDDIQDAYSQFDKFANAINNIFEHFNINLTLTRNSFIPKQEQIIEELILEPVIKGLAGSDWEPVQTELRDAMREYHKGNKAGYSHAITHLASALQAFLQIKVNGKIGKGDIDDLVTKGMSNGVIPKDQLSKKVLNGLVSTVMEYRQKNSDAHPKIEYSNAESVRLLLNVIAVFIQHSL